MFVIILLRACFTLCGLLSDRCVELAVPGLALHAMGRYAACSSYLDEMQYTMNLVQSLWLAVRRVRTVVLVLVLKGMCPWLRWQVS